ncbi:hypothetical protein PR048_009972 [Dryococelus australis]|uniref:Uncharacterized protein n=1 Tax=Dryococelus australis TaxID=614101 RepID=A0ABQ9I1E1_9NEOP|nr:hypothetical protein PR048_009972 [Dryococelus australis]
MCHLKKSANVLDFHKEDLKDNYEDAFKSRMRSMKAKKKKPTCAIDSLAKCDRHMFPNVYILPKILFVLPVSTALVE